MSTSARLLNIHSDMSLDDYTKEDDVGDDDDFDDGGFDYGDDSAY
jgi:hypothetical protein